MKINKILKQIDERKNHLETYWFYYWQRRFGMNFNSGAELVSDVILNNLYLKAENVLKN